MVLAGAALGSRGAGRGGLDELADSFLEFVEASAVGGGNRDGLAAGGAFEFCEVGVGAGEVELVCDEERGALEEGWVEGGDFLAERLVVVIC